MPQLKIQKKDIAFVIKTSLVYCALSAGFSFISILVPTLPGRILLINPIQYGSLNINELIGHFTWGILSAIATLRLRYIILAGLTTVLIDSDHVIGLLHTEGIPRMSHSIVFAILATSVMFLIIAKKDYILASIISTSVLTHISYDVFTSEYGFPILTPFVNNLFQLPNYTWVILEISAILIVTLVMILKIKTDKLKHDQEVNSVGES